MAIDKVTLQILSDHCTAAAESMARTLLRTAHSTFVKERRRLYLRFGQSRWTNFCVTIRSGSHLVDSVSTTDPA